jgi:sulfite exporter TauE/SafE
MVCATALSLILSDSLVETTRLWTHEQLNASKVIIFIVMMLGAFVGPAASVGYAILSSFRRGTRKQMLAIVLVAYASSLLIYAGVYYSIKGLSDENEAERQIVHYQYQAIILSTHRATAVTPYKGQPAFVGMEGHLWTTIEDDVPDIATGNDDSPENIAAIVGSHARSFKFRPQERLGVFADCLHLSVMTMTTVGYGDIIPRDRIAKIVSDLQAITGIVLFVIALGMVFGNWWEDGGARIGSP